MLPECRKSIVNLLNSVPLAGVPPRHRGWRSRVLLMHVGFVLLARIDRSGGEPSLILKLRELVDVLIVYGSHGHREWDGRDRAHVCVPRRSPVNWRRWRAPPRLSSARAGRGGRGGRVPRARTACARAARRYRPARCLLCHSRRSRRYCCA